MGVGATQNTVSGDHSGAIGDPSTVSGNNSYSIGNNNTVSANNTFVLGNDVTANAANSVYLGKGSTIVMQKNEKTAGTTEYRTYDGNTDGMNELLKGANEEGQDGSKSVNTTAYTKFDGSAEGIYNHTELLQQDRNKTTTFRDNNNDFTRSQNAIAMGINTYAVKKNSLVVLKDFLGSGVLPRFIIGFF